jgi:hypothetical protein
MGQNQIVMGVWSFGMAYCPDRSILQNLNVGILLFWGKILSGKYYEKNDRSFPTPAAGNPFPFRRVYI